MELRRCVLFLVHTGDSACFEFLPVTRSSSSLRNKKRRHHALLLAISTCMDVCDIVQDKQHLVAAMRQL